MRRRKRQHQDHNFQVLEGEGRRYSYLKQAAVFYIVLLLVVVLLFQVGYHWLGEQYLALRLQIVTAEPGSMDSSIEVAGIVTRNEHIVHAPGTGIVVDLLSPGERVAAGAPLVTIVSLSREEAEAMQEHHEEPVDSFFSTLAQLLQNWLEPEETVEAAPPLVLDGEIPPWFQDQLSVFCEQAGLLSYQLDGWEFLSGKDTPPLEFFETAPQAASPLVEGTFVEQGQPLLKIVNNWIWYYHVALPLNPGRTAAAQQKVAVVFDFAPESPVEASLEDALIDTAGSRVILSYRLDRQLPGFEQARLSEAVISFQRQKGILIPAAALLEKDGEAGVLINQGGMVAFSAVNVIRREDDLALVEGIEPYTLVIARPDLVREGQRLN